MYKFLFVLSLVALVGCDKKETATSETPETKTETVKKEVVEKAAEPVAVRPTVHADAKALLREPAPDFTLNDLDGKPFTLSAHKGKIVVLEWFNPECPYVKAAHGEGSLKTAAKDNDDVVWVAINSGAEGNQGHGLEVNKKGAADFGMEHPILLDEDGKVGRLYDAQRTPHMYVIDTKGTLVYRGGLDTSGSGFPKDSKGPLRNHVQQAIIDLREGKPVAVPTTKSWGCSVKY